MRSLVLLALVGLGAQLVDGSLGMAYGVTSTTLLLAVGTNPAAASATVHLAEIGTTLAAGVSHHRFGNVDWPVVRRIGIPGAVGAFAGATFLSWISTAAAAPITSGLLLALGVYVLARFTFVDLPRPHDATPLRRRFLSPLGFVGGFVDATGGGGWGPIGTPTILASGRLEPRKVVGSIDTAEFLVSLAASLGFFLGIGHQVIVPGMALALLAGGLVAAPLAAWLVRLVPPRVLGASVGGLIVLTNARTILRSDVVGAGDGVVAAVLSLVVVAWVAAVAYSLRAHLRGGGIPRPASAPAPVPDVVPEL